MGKDGMMPKLRLIAIGLAAAFSVIHASPAGAVGQEHPACAATAPDRPATCPPLSAIEGLPLHVRGSHIFFPSGGAFLDQAAKDQLNALVDILSTVEFSGTCLRLSGHADPIGPEDVNLQLSMLRAHAVAEYIIAQMGNDAPDMTIAGFGELEPLINIPKTSVAHRRVALEAKACRARITE